MLTELDEKLYMFSMELPNTPLRTLNCYLIVPETGRALLIDTGFHHPLCFETLRRGMEEAGLRPENTDVFITHAHADHSGNAASLQALGCRLFMSGVDFRHYCGWLETRLHDQLGRAVREGLPRSFLELGASANPIMGYGSGPFTVTELREGDELCYGPYRLCCLLTPGHTPGHMCLYEPDRQILFLGDHVLFDITPNICNFSDVSDSLGDYLDSLEALRYLPVKLALPAHRGLPQISLVERVDQLLAHHQRRLDETLRIVRETPGLDAYRIAGRLHWHIRAASWEEFPPGQKWFALGETLAHLDHLRRLGLLCAAEEDGLVVYRASGT